MHDDMEFQADAEQPKPYEETEEIQWWGAGTAYNDLNWPPRVKEMFGLSAHAPASVIDFYNAVHPEDRHLIAATYLAAIDPARRKPFDTVFRTLGKEDSLVRRIRAQGRGEFTETGQCKRLIGSAVVTAEYGLEQEEKREHISGGLDAKLFFILRYIEREEIAVDDQIDLLAAIAERMAKSSEHPARESVLTLLTAATLTEIRNAPSGFGVAPNLKELMLEAMQVARGMKTFRPKEE